jgi:hypothetical protein
MIPELVEISRDDSGRIFQVEISRDDSGRIFQVNLVGM